MIAMYAGSFSPPTNGHLDVIRRASALFERVIVAIMVNPEKQYILSPEARKDMLQTICAVYPNVQIEVGVGLTAVYARTMGADVLIRGVRNASDLEMEMQAAQANRMINGIDTLLLPASADQTLTSSTIVRDIASYGGPIESMTPIEITDTIKRAYGRDR